jgi:fructosamine-3-kinase
MAKTTIDRALIVKMHDAYMQEYKQELYWEKEWRKIYAEQKHWRQEAEARLHQGKATALIHVINDLRHVLGRKPIGVDSNAYGYIFDIE